MKKRRIIILLFIFILLIIGITINVKNKKSNEKNQIQEGIGEKNFIEYGEGNKQNISEEINKKRTFEKLDIINTSILYIDGKCNMKLDIKNNSESKTDDILIKVNILDKNRNNIITLDGFIAGINPGESTEMNISSSFDFSNAYDYEILRK